ncbi:hypothetical protein BVRB_1g013220 [Beta vulgaris subsp. vulgaris]|nr:hypothetical protein BVRB_1g013220 [Beta vulgaris subsp. vulgaris]
MATGPHHVFRVGLMFGPKPGPPVIRTKSSPPAWKPPSGAHMP